MKHLYLHRLTRIAVFCIAIGWTLSSGANSRGMGLEHKVLPASAFEAGSMKLVGTAVTGDPNQTVAVIEDRQNRRQWLFHEGDRAGRILFKKIHHDHIIIDTGDGKVVVKLNGNLTTGAQPAVQPVGKRSDSLHTSVNRAGSRDRYKVVDRTALEAALADPQAILERIDIMPARLFNREVGFRITGFDADSILAKLGLRSGDLILAINDRNIAGPQEAETLFKTISEGGDMDLTVRRRARTYHINLLIQ